LLPCIRKIHLDIVLFCFVCHFDLFSVLCLLVLPRTQRTILHKRTKSKSIHVTLTHEKSRSNTGTPPRNGQWQILFGFDGLVISQVPIQVPTGSTLLNWGDRTSTGISVW